MDELKIDFVELGFLNLLKIVSYENDGNITIKNLYKTLMKRDVESIQDMGIESILFFSTDLLPVVLFEKGYISEKNIKLIDVNIQKSTEKSESESKLWKGLKKYLRKDIYDELNELSISKLIDFLPYAIIFNCHEDLIDCVLTNFENATLVDMNIIETIDALNKEIQILDDMMFA